MLCLTQRQSMRFVLIAVGPMAVGVAWLASMVRDAADVAPGRWSPRLVLVARRSRRRSPSPGRGTGCGSCSGGSRPRRTCPPRADLSGRPLDRRATCPRRPGWSARTTAASTSPAPTRWSWPTAAGPAWARAASGRGDRGSTCAMRGFTHLLLCPPVPETAVEFDPTLGRRLAPWLAGGTPLYREEHRPTPTA